MLGDSGGEAGPSGWSWSRGCWPGLSVHVVYGLPQVIVTWATSGFLSLAASGLPGNFHGDLGSRKQGGGCIIFSNVITGVMQCCFFLI